MVKIRVALPLQITNNIFKMINNGYIYIMGSYRFYRLIIVINLSMIGEWNQGQIISCRDIMFLK